MKARSDASPKPSRRFPWLRVLALVVLLAVLWAVHPPLLARIFRVSLTQAAAQVGLTVEVGTIQANLAKPLIFQDIRVRAKHPEALRTASDIRQVVVVLNWPWQALFGPKRVFHSVVVEGMNGVFDFPPRALPAKPASEPTDEPEQPTASRFFFLPESAEVRGADVEFIFGKQSYYLQEVFADFSVEHLGRFKARNVEIRIGDFYESLGSLKAITAWKAGSLYLADLDVREGVKLDNLEAHLGRQGGLALGLEAAIYGGTVRADISFEGPRGEQGIDAAISASNVQAAPLADLLGLRGKVEGVLREGRLTFRGLPSKALDGEVSLRLAATDFRWNQRGWESLTIGANMIHRRLAISDFVLKQKDNSLTASGEVSLSENWRDWARAPFQLNLTGSINDLGALASLFGPPFQDLSGRMSLSSSLSGQISKLSGFLILEASGMKFRKHPFESGRLDVSFAGNEAQVNQCELWSSGDYVRGKGSLQLSAPHTYSGDIQGRANDLAAYFALLSPSPSSIYAGAADLRWQGDGTISSHSGAFNIALDKFVSKRTPSGLTGRFAGTYSPQNIYFSGFELQQGSMLFSTQATLASSGIKFTNTLLRSGKTELASGEFYLPINPFSLLGGRSLGESVDLEKPVYASITSRGSANVRDLLRLGGHDLPAEGSISLDVKASGSLATLKLDAKLDGRGLGLHLEDSQDLTSRLETTVHTAGGRADLDAVLETRGLSPATFKIQGPFGLFKSPDGSLHFARPEDSIAAQADIPKANLEVLRPFVSDFRQLAGVVSGTLSASGSVTAPLVSGSLSLTAGSYEPFPRFPVITGLTGTVRFDSTTATLETLTGDLAKGPFELKGGVSFADFANWHYDFSFSGSKLLLFRDPALKLRANVSLLGSGNVASGLLKGTLSFVDSRMEKRLEVIPLLSHTAATTFHPPPSFSRWIPAAFQNWTADIAVSNETPVLIANNAADAGEMNLSLRLGGIMGKPFPVGRIDLKNVRTFLPFTGLNISEGHLDFIENSPWIPQIDVRGTAQMLDYSVQAYAFGPLNERRLILRSDPPLSQDSLVSLLATGILPGAYASASLSGIIPPSSKPNLTQAFSRQLDPLDAVPQTAAAPRGRFQLWQDLSLTREGDGFSSSSPTYSLRFH